jgi:bifunctional enzyme CysN/CysC
MDERHLIETDIEAFLEQNEKKDLLRFVTVGSVDDGKSTLIGRLLHDTKGVYDDQLKDATRTSATGEKAIDFARITDGLRAEREQGITIDVAYRYFSTPKRKFIIADTPGHVQYTRNMATGASTADVAIILIDARLGVLKQSRRHAYIASLLGIPNLLVCVNKMDLADYDEKVFDSIVEDFRVFADNLAYGTEKQKRVRGAGQCAGFASVTFIPISALMGINIVESDEALTPWYSGGSVLNYLETVTIHARHETRNFRFPVQYVIRPNLDYRGYAGQVVSGVIRPGDEVMVLPSGKRSRVRSIDTYDGPLEKAFAPLPAVLRLEDEIDISRGDILAHPDAVTFHGREVEAMVVWMSETPLYADKSYLIKIGTRYVRTKIGNVQWRVVLDTLENTNANNKLELNEIGKVHFTTHQPIVFDSYKRNRHTGAFIIIDSLTNNTVGAGMILEPATKDAKGSEVEVTTECQVSPSELSSRLRQQGVTLILNGLPSSGRSTIAFSLERALFDQGYLAVVIDSKDQRYASHTPENRAELAKRFNDAGLIVISSESEGFDSAELENSRCLTIHVSTPAQVCSQWGAGAKTNAAKDYSAPEEAFADVDLSSKTVEACVSQLVEALREAGHISDIQ